MYLTRRRWAIGALLSAAALALLFPAGQARAQGSPQNKTSGRCQQSASQGQSSAQRQLRALRNTLQQLNALQQTGQLTAAQQQAAMQLQSTLQTALQQFTALQNSLTPSQLQTQQSALQLRAAVAPGRR